MLVKVRGTMELAKRISLCLVAVMISFSVIAQEKRVNFYQKLMLQEKQEREELEQMIESLSDEEYRSYLNRQLSQVMKAAGTNIATVIVDVTDMQSATTALKGSSEISLGAMKLKSLMAQAPLAKSNLADVPNAGMNIANKQWEFSNKAGSKQFEQLNIELGGSALDTLLNSAGVKDIFITTGSQYGTKYSAINTELGRFYPPIVAKAYDREFLRKGHLKDILTVLEQNKTMRINVTLKGYPETDFLSDEDYIKGEQLTEEVLSDLNPRDYDVGSKNPYGFYIVAGKKVVKQLSKDTRVDMISEKMGSLILN
jgi:hypothetical protein